MDEKDYYGNITAYYTAHNDGRSIAWEAKITKKDSILYTALKPHQEEKLLKAERAYGEKIADVGYAQKPFDGWVLVGAKAVVIVIFYKERKTIVVEIPIRAWVDECYDNGGRKSLTKERALEIGTVIHI
jgi:penicillin-binding protein-related factor A (putative recombinase)